MKKLLAFVLCFLALPALADLKINGVGKPRPTVFNVLDYGASPNDQNEDQVYINSAIAAANAAGGGVVFIPAGTYVVTTSVAPLSNVIIRGAGRYATTIQVKAGSNNVSPVNALNASGFAVESLTIDGNSANTTGTSHTVRGAGITDARYFDLEIKNSRTYCMGFQDGAIIRLVMDNLYLHNCGADAVDFKDPLGKNDAIKISRVHIHIWDEVIGVQAAALDLRGKGFELSQITVTGGTPDGSGQAIRIRNYAGAATQAITNIVDNVSDQGVVTVAAHGYEDGNFVYLNDIVGTVELNDRLVIISNKTTNNFRIKDIDTEAYISVAGMGAYVSGGTISQTQSADGTPPTEAPLSTLTNFYVDMAGGATSQCLNISARGTRIVGGICRNANTGVVIQADRVSITGVVSESNHGSGFQIGGAFVADYVNASDLVAYSNGGAGFKINDDYFNCTGCQSYWNTLEGFDIEATAIGTRLTGGVSNSNQGAAITNGGTDSLILGVYGSNVNTVFTETVSLPAILTDVNIPSQGTYTIASDAITITGAGRASIDTEAAGATDTISTINGGTAGDVMILQTVSSARDVTFADNTGNFRIGADCVLNTTSDKVVLYFDNPNWSKISCSDND